MLALTASNPLDTERIAQRIAALVRAGDLITLVGEMGAGKTYFAQCFGRALGVSEPITSPTFNLLHTYGGGRLPMHHADLYRLERTGEIADLGITELLGAGGVALVEWGDVAGEELGGGLSVHLHTSAELSTDARRIDIGWMGLSWESRWEKLRSSLSEWARS
jgi:tRNA threonylcarbamoyladenosine biosynthesis protein TsaE